MSERRRALGRGLGALIPSGAGENQSQRPVDVFFRDRTGAASTAPTSQAPPAESASTETKTDAAASDTPAEGSQEASSNAATARAGQASADSPDDATSAEETPLSASEALLHELESADQSESTRQAKARTGTKKSGSPQARTKRPAGGSKSAARSTTASSTAKKQQPSPEPATEDLQPVPGATFAEVPIESLSPNASQPRQVFDDDELNELASSIREVGVLQPVVVRPSGTDADEQPTYELIMGERRWRAARIAALETIPAIIRQTAHEDMLRDALLENLHRVQLNPLEEAAAYQQLLEDFGCTHDELALRIARSRPQISNTLRLLRLPPLVQRRVAAGILSAGHARALLGLSDGAAMERLAQRIVAEGLSVRATEEIIALGDEPMQPEMRRRAREGGHSVALNDLAGRLSDNLDTKVKVKLGQRKGHVSIEFASMGDLNRILGVLVPSDPGVSDTPEEPAGEEAPAAVETGD